MMVLKGYKVDEVYSHWIYFEQYKGMDGRYYYSKYDIVRDKEKIKELEKGIK